MKILSNLFDTVFTIFLVCQRNPKTSMWFITTNSYKYIHCAIAPPLEQYIVSEGVRTGNLLQWFHLEELIKK